MTYRFFKSSGIVTLSLLFLFLPGIDSAAGQIPLVQSHSFNPVPPINQAPNSSVQGRLQILAVMVEFQPDSNRFTSGNGTFEPGSIPYLEYPGTPIDALPHNLAYFEAHLEFAKNYFEKMSNGLLEIEYHVLPDVYRLPHQMEHYSPTGQNPELTPLTSLASDAWESVAAGGNLPVEIHPGENTAFVIFHAGIGRDIELTGTTLYKTPQDIPSVYLSKQAFQRLLNDPSFSGFEIDGSNLIVDNTLIVPRTLTRAGEDISGQPFILPLSTNGLITAQIGSHLGLPDLFNTETGESGIGRFGLMDGAGIFSYNGLYPPELSAWERIYMGWAEPFTVQYNEDLPVSLPAVSMQHPHSIAKIELSDSEYFLIENRHRDPTGDGVTFTIQKPDGGIVKQTFTNRDEQFISQQSGFDSLLEPGIIINSSNFDFSLPGGLVTNEDGEHELNGGILIWHIDESVIEKKLGLEGINNNPGRRAVNLQEADGAQDIGRRTAIGLFQNEVNGWAFDFWWSGNDATVITPSGEFRLYENRFGPDTYPNNRSNSGAPSFFELYNFSDNLPVAQFQIREIQPYSEIYSLRLQEKIPGFQSNTSQSNQYLTRYPLAIQPIDHQSAPHIIIPGKNSAVIFDMNEARIKETIQTQSLRQPFIDRIRGFFTIAEVPGAGDQPISVSGYSFQENELNLDWMIQAAPIRGFISSSEPGILDFDATNLRFDLQTLQEIVESSARWYSAKIGNYQSYIENNSLVLEYPGGTQSVQINTSGSQRIHTGIFQADQNNFIFYLLTDGKITLFSPETDPAEKTVIADAEFIDWPSFSDFNKDGTTDIIYVNQTLNRIEAKNLNGAMLSNFPVIPPAETHFIGTPLIADINGNGEKELLITGQDPYSLNIFAFTQSGDIPDGFPLYVGSVENINEQPVHPLIVDQQLIAISHQGDLKIWEFPNIGSVEWPSRYGKNTSNKIGGTVDLNAEQQPGFSLLNKNETYNWPNPAKDQTFLRYQTSEPAEIHIKITNVSGRPIYDEKFQSRGGPPEEILLDTSRWASGGYFALLEAKSATRTERKIIKIAIAR